MVSWPAFTPKQDDYSVLEATRFVLGRTAPPPGVDPKLYAIAVGNAVMAGQRGGRIDANDLPNTAQIQYAVALEQQLRKEDAAMVGLASGMAVAAVAETAAGASLMDDLAMHTVADALLDSADSFLHACGFGNSRDNRMLVQYADRRMATIFKGDPAMQKLGTMFSVAAGATIAQKDRTQLMPSVKATVDAIEKLPAELKKQFEGHMKGQRVGEAADVVYGANTDASKELRQKLREQWRKERGLDPKPEATGQEDGEIKKHFREGTEQKFHQLQEHQNRFGLSPSRRAGSRPNMRTAEFMPGTDTPKAAATPKADPATKVAAAQAPKTPSMSGML